MKNVYIITKPLQYVNVLNMKSNDISCVLLLVTSFSNAQAIYEKIKSSDIWSDVISFDTILTALKWCIKNKSSLHELYINSDCGFRINYHLYRLRRVHIYVYDEGWGTYRSDLKKKNNLIRVIFALLTFTKDLDMYFGASPYTRGIFVYFPEVHKRLIPQYKKELFKFNTGFCEYLLNNNTLFPFFQYKTNKVFINKHVLLYLSNWSFNDTIIGLMAKYPNYIKIYKPHPHNANKSSEHYFDITIGAQYMAEFVISAIAQEASELLIIHEGTTSVLYFQKKDNIRFINIGKSNQYKRVELAIYNTLNTTENHSSV